MKGRCRFPNGRDASLAQARRLGGVGRDGQVRVSVSSSLSCLQPDSIFLCASANYEGCVHLPS